MGETSIEWTDSTWNPIRGCSRVSPGCAHCYAEGIARRFSGPGLAYEGLVRIDPTGRPQQWNGKIKFVQRHLQDPLKWKEPKRIFVNSMSDLFHENVRIEWLESILQVVSDCPQHQFQVLTKRTERMRKLMSMLGAFHAGERMAVCIGDGESAAPFIMPNLWLGTSVENRDTKHRIETLQDVPTAIRFLSIEPLLEDIGHIDLLGIHWVIVGGESGPGARPCNVEWIRSVIRQCKAASVPVFCKQLGRAPYQGADVIGSDGLEAQADKYATRTYFSLEDKKGGDVDEWPLDLRVREFPK